MQFLARMMLAVPFVTAGILSHYPVLAADQTTVLKLTTRRLAPMTADTNRFSQVEKIIAWAPQQTAAVICDMWDQHWCQGATKRVAEMAPRMNAVIAELRQRGVLIIHCPSGTMKFYEDTPQRKLAQAAPKVTPKAPLQGWCSLDRSREAPLPIDDSDGGCDDEPKCASGNPWRRQIATLEIKEGDAITDSAEAYYLMRQRGITNVMVMGVHENMCVLGRPFSIRQMVNLLLSRRHGHAEAPEVLRRQAGEPLMNGEALATGGGGGAHKSPMTRSRRF